MVFRAGLRDPYTRDVARLSESVKILEPQASVFLRFPKVEQHPKCMDHAKKINVLSVLYTISYPEYEIVLYIKIRYV
jgi:hypothetical protein